MRQQNSSLLSYLNSLLAHTKIIWIIQTYNNLPKHWKSTRNRQLKSYTILEHNGSIILCIACEIEHSWNLQNKKKKKEGTVKRVRSSHGILVRAEYLLVHLFPHGDTHCCGIILFELSPKSGLSEEARRG